MSFEILKFIFLLISTQYMTVHTYFFLYNLGNRRWTKEGYPEREGLNRAYGTCKIKYFKLLNLDFKAQGHFVGEM